MTSSTAADDSDGSSMWSILGMGGLVSLCCLFAAPMTAGAAGTAAGAGSAAALGGTRLQIAVTALTIGLFAIGLGVYRRSQLRERSR